MIKTKTSIKISIGVCFFVAFVLLVLVIFGPTVFEWYMTAYRGFLPNGKALMRIKTVFTYCFYPSAVFSSIILYSLLKLLFNIKNDKVFIPKNAAYLRFVSYCLLAIGIITFIGGFFYMPFMFVCAAGLFTGMMMRALKNVFETAITLREENDLTI